MPQSSPKKCPKVLPKNAPKFSKKCPKVLLKMPKSSPKNGPNVLLKIAQSSKNCPQVLPKTVRKFSPKLSASFSKNRPLLYVRYYLHQKDLHLRDLHLRDKLHLRDSLQTNTFAITCHLKDPPSVLSRTFWLNAISYPAVYQHIPLYPKVGVTVFTK